MLGQNQIGLNPGNALARINQQLSNTSGIDAAVFVQLFAALMCDRFNAALHRDAPGAAQQLQRFLVPEIDAGLTTDLYRTFCNLLQQAADVCANSENFVDEINVADAAGDQRIHFPEHGIHAALAKFIAEQRLVAEGAGPGTAAGKLQFGAQSAVTGKDVVAMPVSFDVIVPEVKRAQSAQ